MFKHYHKFHLCRRTETENGSIRNKYSVRLQVTGYIQYLGFITYTTHQLHFRNIPTILTFSVYSLLLGVNCDQISKTMITLAKKMALVYQNYISDTGKHGKYQFSKETGWSTN